jgi:methionine synthase II (cobalamin-independent)
MMNVFDKYYKDEKKVKHNIVLLIAKNIKELVSKPVRIDIDKHILSIKLNKV